MAWILDEYSKFHGHSPAVVTGKPIVSIKRETEKQRNKNVSDRCMVSRRNLMNSIFPTLIWNFRISGDHSEGKLLLDLECSLQPRLYWLNMENQFPI